MVLRQWLLSLYSTKFTHRRVFCGNWISDCGLPEKQPTDCLKVQCQKSGIATIHTKRYWYSYKSSMEKLREYKDKLSTKKVKLKV